jgi:translation initiation factor 2B subunit (eIF-2B alpha/beta/delta family)
MEAIDRVFARAAEDRHHGAQEIERKLISGLLAKRSSWTREALARGASRLRESQPIMANLRVLARMVSDGEFDGVERRLRDRAEVLSELDERLAEAAWPRVEPLARVVTISRSSAVAAVLLGARSRGWQGEVVVFDGSPEGRGKSQSERLARTMPGVLSQPDAAMARWLAGGDVGVLVGADAVSTERVVNVCGTAVLLELAAGRGVPVILVADTGKDLPDDEIDSLLEACPKAGKGSQGRRWPLFEAAPMTLVSERIHE